MNASPPSAVLPESASDELDERRLRVVAEQAVGLRWQILLTATIVTAIVWQSVPAPVVLGWFAAVIASRELRAAAAKPREVEADVKADPLVLNRGRFFDRKGRHLRIDEVAR